MGQPRWDVGGAKRDIAQGTQHVCCVAQLGRTSPCSAAAAKLKTSSPGWLMLAGDVSCTTQESCLVQLPLYHSRKRTGTVDTQASPLINSNLSDMRKMQILRQSLGRISAPL